MTVVCKVMARLCLTITLMPTQFTLAMAAEPFATYFSDAGISGTIVVERMSNGKRWIHNPMRAVRRYIPASTFKIPHALIALELGVIQLGEVMPWDGKIRRIKSWNRPQTLKQAIKNSAVPVFQQIAGRIGLKRMQRGVEQLQYGNQNIGYQVDQFWLDGPLQISAIEQIEFLKRLNRHILPMSTDVQSAVVELLPASSTLLGLTREKTGWSIGSKPAIGWYVGWLEASSETYFFALNLDMKHADHAAARKSIVHQILSHILGDNG